MPVQNFFPSGLATHLFQILIPTTLNSLLCQIGNLHFSFVLKDGLLGKSYYPEKFKIENS